MHQKTYDILDYLAMRGDIPFEQVPFNSVDALVLCQLAYNNVDGLIPENLDECITVKKLWEKFSSAEDYKERCNVGAMINKLTPVLLEKAAESKRFSSVKAKGFVNTIDEANIEQFAAVTFEIDKNENVVCFRGTDDTIVGWYEDFNLGYMEMIPAQKDAISYLNKAMEELSGKIYVAGHSKGANLAVKAALCVDSKQLNRIAKVYNFDGPGFSAGTYKEPQFLQLEAKIESYFPEFCVVGMLFEHTEKFQIVSSTENGVMQHDPFSWEIKGGGFEQAQDFDKASKLLHQSFNEWTEKLSAEEKKEFIDTFFDIVYASGVKTNYEIDQNKLVCGTKMLTRLSELEENKRESVTKGIHKMIEAVKGNLPLFSIFEPKQLVKEQINKLRR